MSIVVGGGTGFIGRHLSRLGLSKGFNVINVSRKPGKNAITWQELSRNGLPENCVAVVSMSGEPILQPFKKWTPDFKAKVRESRVEKTQLLNKAISLADKPPKVFISLSGVSYYKPDPTKEYTEDDKVAPYDFLSELTEEWESSAALPESSNTRSVIIRTGVVMGKDGGMVKDIKIPFFLGVGGPTGGGEQWFPWIHVEDMAGLIMWSMENEGVSGVLNGTAPGIVRNGEFMKAFASAMSRPGFIPLPSFVANTVFGSDAAKIMLEGQKVLPKRATDLGYKFVYPDPKSACSELVTDMWS